MSDNMGLLGLLRGNRAERAGFELYGRAVAAARAPTYFTDLGVPDTLDGRFDMVGLHAWLLIRRLRREPPPGPALAQAIFDAMFSDMDVNLRELGVGDLSVGKRVRAMWEAFHGRAAAYEAAMADERPGQLSDALRRNVWRGAGNDEQANELARQVRTMAATLAEQPLGAFAKGHAAFSHAPADPQ